MELGILAIHDDWSAESKALVCCIAIKLTDIEC